MANNHEVFESLRDTSDSDNHQEGVLHPDLQAKSDTNEAKPKSSGKPYDPKYNFEAHSDSIYAKQHRAEQEYNNTGNTKGPENRGYQKELNDYTIQMAAKDSAEATNKMKKFRDAEKRGAANEVEGGELSNRVKGQEDYDKKVKNKINRAP